MNQVDPVVRMRDIRRAHLCSRGARAFFRAHGLDWDRFLREGIPTSELEATQDAMALEVVRMVRNG